MNWKDIVASHEREDAELDPFLEPVIEALELLFGNRRQVIESNILGVQRESDLDKLVSIDKEYITNLIGDIKFAYSNRNPTGSQDHLKAIEALNVVLRTAPEGDGSWPYGL